MLIPSQNRIAFSHIVLIGTAIVHLALMSSEWQYFYFAFVLIIFTHPNSQLEQPRSLSHFVRMYSSGHHVSTGKFRLEGCTLQSLEPFDGVCHLSESLQRNFPLQLDCDLHLESATAAEKGEIQGIFMDCKYQSHKKYGTLLKFQFYSLHR